MSISTHPFTSFGPRPFQPGVGFGSAFSGARLNSSRAEQGTAAKVHTNATRVYYFDPPTPASMGFVGFALGSVLAVRGEKCRPRLAPAIEVEKNWSSNPCVELPRFINRLVHCSEGSPFLPASKETVLPPVSHKVSN
jgi:hypothetical protein